MPRIQTVFDWKAHKDKSLDPTDKVVLTSLSFSQARADCAILSQAEIAEDCGGLRVQHVNRSLHKLERAGHIEIHKVPGIRNRKYVVKANAFRNKRTKDYESLRLWASKQAEELRQARDQIAKLRRAEIAVLTPKSANLK